MSRRRVSDDNEFSMFSPEQIVHESRPSHLVVVAWTSIAFATFLFWCGVFAIMTWMSR
ncbi:MAG: hypothetical protein NT138_02295 [Planctomycetales bacterium]|nr:hypothetical protein [Planctomycetales bacterium]